MTYDLDFLVYPLRLNDCIIPQIPKNYDRLRCLNEKFEWFEITDYDMREYGYPK